MRVDIEPYWRKLANWYWDNASGRDGGMSIWQMLERDYGAIRVYNGPNIDKYGPRMLTIVDFPNEKTYAMFLLRWS